MAVEVKRSFFYGWVIVFGTWLVLFVNGGAIMTFSVFFPPLMNEFGWTRGMLSLGFTINTLIWAPMDLVTGMLVDRIGPRRTVLIGAIIGGIGIGLLSQVSQIWHFYLFYGVISSIGATLAGWVATISTVRRWFMRRAGLMLSIAVTGSGLGVVILAPVASLLLDVYDWRRCYIILGVILAVGATIGGALLIKDPESAGTYPDGIKPSEEEMKVRADFMARTERWSLKEAATNRNFWFYVMAVVGYFVALNGLISSILIWGMDLGMSRGAASNLLSFFILSAVVARVCVGFLSDWTMARFKGTTRKPALFLCLASAGLGCFLGAAIVNNPTGLLVIAIIAGFGVGIGLSLFPTYLGDLFGVANIPMLTGFAGLCTAAFSAIGPALFGFSFDAIGSYDLALNITGILCMVSMISLALIKTPVKRGARAAV